MHIEHAGEDAKVNAWEAPTEISRWKEEHVSSHLVFVDSQCSADLRLHGPQKRILRGVLITGQLC